MPSRSGYTLVELLVVLGLLALVVGAALLFLTSILRGTNQSNISAEVKQNGQAVLDSLERQIRGAKSASDMTGIAPPPGVSDWISLALSDGSTMYIGCLNPTANLNGAIGTKGGSIPTSANDFQTLTNRDPVSGINIATANCSLSVPAPVSTLNADSVVVSFTADRAIKAPSRADFNASAQFRTTISLRKY